MARPGTIVTTREDAPPRSAPTETGVWFVAGLAERGPTTPKVVTSLDGFRRIYGQRVSYGLLADALEAFFHDGGSRAWVARVVGPAAVAATADLPGTGGATLVASAKGPGEHGNALTVDISAGDTADTFVVTVKDGATVLDRSPELDDDQAAVAWSDGSAYVTLAKGAGTGDPTVGSVPLAGGSDDRNAIVEAQWTAALDRFDADLGPGQVSLPGRTTGAAHAALLAHAGTHNRIALLDAPNTVTVGTLTSAATAARASGNSRFGALLAPWGIAPGVVPGTTRLVPLSAVQAALIARGDAGGSPNRAAAGGRGESNYLLGVTQAWTDGEREVLNEAGVNVSRNVFGGIRAYGYRTLADPIGDVAWLELGNARLFMAIRAKGAAIAENYVFGEIDGRGITAAQFAGDLVGMLIPYYESGSLYGSTPGEAFSVDVGAQVNTPESIANRELRAVISVRVSHFAELVAIEIAKVPTTEAIA
jgi:hypothetical protein